MSSIKPVDLILTCASWHEAQKIADSLLEKRLVCFVETVEANSKHRRDGELEVVKEIKLIMRSIEMHFDSIKAEVTKLLKSDKYVLEELPFTNISNPTDYLVVNENKTESMD